MNGLLAPTAEFPYPTLPIAADKLDALMDSLVGAHLDYQMGGKGDPLSLQAEEFSDHGITGLDCSGLVRWIIFHAMDQPSDFNFADGSAEQHEQIQAVGFKPSQNSDGLNHDGVIRIAFLTPEDGGVVGHVLLIHGGATAESYGGRGPGFRTWGAEGFMQKMHLYVLALP